jgi:hypothetical protein
VETLAGEGAAVAAAPSEAASRTDASAWWTVVALALAHAAVDCCSGIWPVFKTLARLDIATAGATGAAAGLSRRRVGFMIALFLSGGYGVNNIAAVAEGNRLLPGQASAVSALLMGLPWCVAALGPVVAGVLADPARGGTPAGALAWFLLLMPLGLAAALGVRPRGTAAERGAALGSE